MNRIHTYRLALLTLFLYANLQAAAYIKFDGVDGEAADSKHDKWIDVLSVDWGTSTGVPPLKSDRAAPQKLTVKAHTGKATPKLPQYCAKGAQYQQIQVRIGRRTEATTYALTDVRVINYRGKAKGDRLVENVTLNYSKIRHIPKAPAGARKGNVETEFKVEKGEK
jgi:type VI secretion system secreted protein Hcp